MLFSTPIFLFVFLPLTLAAWFLSRRHKAVLLVASLIFYSWDEPAYIWLLLFVIVFNYYLGERLAIASQWRPTLFIFALSTDIVVLLGFKYASFLAENINLVLPASSALPVPHLGLPLGVSFFTFQALAYLIDIYLGHIQPAGSLYRFALFKTFFPQLIAGPIVRYQQVAEDFAADHSSVKPFAEGARRFVIGLAKKIIIADNLAPVVDTIFAIPAEHMSMSTSWLGAVCFTLQIYFDFSGYSDMAIGMGKMFGIHLPENFNYPYVASSMRDFWRRWHMSLSTWFRDYLYLPLGGNRHGIWRTYANLLLVFALCGLWHGAAWTFLFWGIYHGIFLILERGIFGRFLNQLSLPLRHAYLIVTVMVGWVLFRSPTLNYALSMIGSMFGRRAWSDSTFPMEMFINPFVTLLLMIGALSLFPWTGLRQQWNQRSGSIAACVQPVGFAILMICSLAFVASQTHLSFIYFHF